MTEAERRRLQDAFRRLASPGSAVTGGSSSGGTLSRSIFLREVLGDGVPVALGERIFALCTGTGNGGSGGGGGSMRGIHFREVLTVLVLITRGSQEEKIKCKSSEISGVAIFPI